MFHIFISAHNFVFVFFILFCYLPSYRSLLSYLTVKTESVEYNLKGTRLLCAAQRCAKNGDSISIYDLLQGASSKGEAKNVISLDADYYVYPSTIGNSCCFAGRNDELVAAASLHRCVFIWSVPDSKEEKQMIWEPLMVLTGHETFVNNICFNRHYSTLASSEKHKTIKLWTPFKLPSTDGETPAANKAFSDCYLNYN